MSPRPIPAPFNRFALAALALLALALVGLAGAAPAAADWLVTRGGDKVETRGPWKVEGERVLFTDARGSRASLAVAKVDLEASAAATAQASRITLYATSWCGYCRKTRELLAELGVAYVEKDVEKSAEGRKEYQAKGKGYRGVPLLDIGGTIVRGYEPEEIRSLVAALGEKAKSTEPQGEGPGE
jgi:mycoredoxin